MDIDRLQHMSPYVNHIKRKKWSLPYGEYIDYDYVFSYIEHGEVDYNIDGQQFRLFEGDVVLTSPHAVHAIWPRSKDALQETLFHFDLFYDAEMSRLDPKDTERIPYLAKYPPLDEKQNFFIARLSAQERYQMRQQLSLMLMEQEERCTGYELVLKAACLQILVILARSAGHNNLIASVKPQKTWSVIDKAVRYIQEHYMDPELDNDTLSKAVELTPNYLSKVFTDHLGLSVHRYVTQLRIDKAKRLMAQSSKNLTQIAFEVGFSSIHTFSKIFKRVEGISPSEFIEKRFSAAALARGATSILATSIGFDKKA